MTVNTWSTTAASNSTADPSINWPEGQAPSSVNDSARAMMAAVAKWRDDNAGTLTTGGTTTAYTLTSNQVFSSLTAMNGMSLRVKFNATNGAAPTLNVDGLGAKAIQTLSGTAVGTAMILANTVHDLVYDNSASAWILVSNFHTFVVGTRMLFQQTAAPAGWTKDSSSYNNYALRLVTGSVTTGGSTGFTSVFASRTITQGNLPSYTLSNTLAISDPGHAHDLKYYQGAGNQNTLGYPAGTGVSGADFNFRDITSSQSFGVVASATTGITITGSVTSGGSGTAMDFAVLYADAIIAAKA